MSEFVKLQGSGLAKLASLMLELQAKLVELNIKQKANRGIQQVRMHEAEVRRVRERSNPK